MRTLHLILPFLLFFSLTACTTPAEPTPAEPTPAEPTPPRETSDDPLSGSIWWDAPATDNGCAEWTFVPLDGGVSLEHTYLEETEAWSREVRVFYNIALPPDQPPYMYAPGWDYTWIRHPTNSAPAQRGAAGHIDYFCLLHHDDHHLTWTESTCNQVTDTTPRHTWYRHQQDCQPSP